MISVAEADAVISKAVKESYAERVYVQPYQKVSLESSLGRTMTEDLLADRDQPPFDRVAMDGLSIKFDPAVLDQTLNKVAYLQAGSPNIFGSPWTQANDALEVMTGAALIEPWNTIIPWEDLDQVGTDNLGSWRIKAGLRVREDQHIHHRASDYAAGQNLLQSGTTIGPAHIHLLASNGVSNVSVYRQPQIALVSTGDELVAVEDTPLPHQIRRSNLIAIAAALHRLGLTSKYNAHAIDEREDLHTKLALALQTCDIVIVSGAVSMGSFDLVPSILQELGCSCLFHKIAQKPGKPLWFGKGPHGQLIFALPGNPVSSLVCFRRLVLPWICPALNAANMLHLPLAEDCNPAHSGFTRFAPACLVDQGFGPSQLSLGKAQGSGNFFSLIPSDGIVEIPPNDKPYPAGSVVRFFPWY